jgi:hypothetical protein
MQLDAVGEENAPTKQIIDGLRKGLPMSDTISQA